MVKIFQFITALSIYRWLKPRIKSLGLLCAFIYLIFYLHNEFLEWSKLTENLGLVGYSYILKNLLIIITLLIYFLIMRIKSFKEETDNSILKGDGFDKFRSMKKVRTKSQQILENKK
tara:strand:+ start:458 stop:808 length:351 start_codon:yes stop_codon:yes gene_type:complete